MTAAGRRRLRVSAPWAAASLCMALLIWANSLVPGDESAGLSLAVLDALQGALGLLGLPSAWLTNFLVRKAAHFCEYALLGFLVAQALDPSHEPDLPTIACLVLVLVAVPAIDETIQLFVDGRSGQVRDVLLDCCGAACAVVVRGVAVQWFPMHRSMR